MTKVKFFSQVDCIISLLLRCSTVFIFLCIQDHKDNSAQKGFLL